jgi:hypothetical protein
MTDEIDALERDRVEPTAKPACQLCGGKPPSEPWQVEQVNAAMLCQRLDDQPPPAPRAGQAVYKDDRFALAGDPILGRRPVDHELPNLHDDQSRSRWHRSGHTLRKSTSRSDDPVDLVIAAETGGRYITSTIGRPISCTC